MSDNVPRFRHQYQIEHNDFLRMCSRHEWWVVQRGTLVLRICKVPKHVTSFRVPEYDFGGYAIGEDVFYTDHVPPKDLKELVNGKLKPLCECCETTLRATKG